MLHSWHGGEQQMDEDEFVTVSDESLRIADDLTAALYGVGTAEGVQALVIVLSNLLADTAPHMAAAKDMSYAIKESVDKSIESMDTERLCRWSTSQFN